MSSTLLSRRVLCITLAFFLCGVASTVDGQVLHSAPKTGQWVEFEGQERDSEETVGRPRVRPVRARFSCVADETIDNKPSAWVEIEWNTVEPIDPRNFPFRMKLLVPRKLGDFETARRIKCKTYVQHAEEPALRPAKPASDEVIDDIRGRYCGCVPPIQIMTAAGEEQILIGEKKTKAKLYHYVQQDDEGTKVEHRYWLAQDVPFGVAKFAYKLTRADGTGGETEMTVSKQGTDAQPQWSVPAQ